MIVLFLPLRPGTNPLHLLRPLATMSDSIVVGPLPTALASPRSLQLDLDCPHRDYRESGRADANDAFVQLVALDTAADEIPQLVRDFVK